MSSAGTDAASRQDVELGRTASRALSWSLVNTATIRFGTLAINVILARLIGPEAFGTYAIALVALAAVLSFNELGVSLAIVRWDGDPKEIAPTVATISVGTSLFLTVGAFLAAPAFCDAMGDPGATDVVRLMTVCILLSGIVATPAALLQREFLQRRRMVIDQINVWVGALLSVALALAGLGAMSLAIGRVVATVISAVLFIAAAPLPLRFGIARGRLRALLHFGLPLAGSSLIVFGVAYADQIVVSSMLGPTALGYYVLAFNLASWPVNTFSQPLRSVAPAMFARLQSKPRTLRRTFTMVFALVGVVALPICAVLAMAATPIVEVVYGDAWLPAAPVLMWLALLAALRIYFELVYDFLVILGRTRIIFLVQVIWLIILIPCLILGVQLADLAGAAISQLLVAAVIVAPVYLVELHKRGIAVSSLARGSAWSAVGGLGVGLTAAILADAVSPLIACLLAGLVCLGVIGLLLGANRTTVRSLRELVGRDGQEPTY